MFLMLSKISLVNTGREATEGVANLQENVHPAKLMDYTRGWKDV
jgi:hypothetical protein